MPPASWLSAEDGIHFALCILLNLLRPGPIPRDLHDRFWLFRFPSGKTIHIFFVAVTVPRGAAGPPHTPRGLQNSYRLFRPAQPKSVKTPRASNANVLGSGTAAVIPIGSPPMVNLSATMEAAFSVPPVAT